MSNASDALASAAEGESTGDIPLTVNAQYVKDLSFENPHAPQSLLQGQGMPDVSVNVDVRALPLAKPEDRIFEVVLTLRAEARRGELSVFIAELSYAGVLTVGGAVPEDVVRPLLLIHGPHLLFPFARAVLADATRDGGFPPLLINPIDFQDMYRRRLEGEPEATA